jgi:hypothetical protein
MSERMTDEQLRDLRDCNPANPFIAPMAAELLALRAALKKARESHAEDRRLWTADMRAIKAQRTIPRALMQEATEALEKFAPPTFATLRTRMAEWLEAPPRCGEGRLNPNDVKGAIGPK